MSITTDILPYLPQRPPFVMVSTLQQCDEEKAVTGFVITENELFVQDGFLKEPALVENIAQTAAARMGYICRQKNEAVPVGYIGAVQNLIIKKLPTPGQTITTTVTVKLQVMNATIIEGVIHLNNELIASCEMKIFVAEN